jgi:ABC-type Fe3+-hydroxamate transport system substrate-binding protein
MNKITLIMTLLFVSVIAGGCSLNNAPSMSDQVGDVTVTPKTGEEVSNPAPTKDTYSINEIEVVQPIAEEPTADEAMQGNLGSENNPLTPSN